MTITQLPTTISSHRSSPHRITSRDAHLMMGQICTFISKGVREYGRIVNVTATSIRIERMHQTASGEFILHPKQKNSVTKNVITFSRKITTATSAAINAAINAATSAATSAATKSLLRGGIKRRYPNAQST